MINRISRRTGDGIQAANPILILLVALGCSMSAFGQRISNRQLSPLHLPNSMRERLVRRFDLFIEYEKAQSYEKQYELLGKEHMANLLHMDVDKESYIKFKEDSQRAVGRLIELTVKDIKRMPDNANWLSLSVVAKLQKGKTTYSDTPICVAYLENGNWRFSLLYIN
jgi:hypothetical protein